MRAIMYHYVREGCDDLPYFHYLHIDNFCKQLDYFFETDRLIGRDEFEAILNGAPVPQDGILLTFDDGLKDHYHYVLPALQKRGLWGFFYVSTGMYHTGRLMDAHRIHYLLGRFGGKTIAERLETLIKPEMIEQDKIAEFSDHTYQHQSNDAATVEVKRLLNYYLDAEWRTAVLDKLMAEYADESILVNQYYLTPNEIADMEKSGMVMGSHTVSHPVLSRLSKAEQEREITESFDFLEDVTGGLSMPSFCYPFGRPKTFTNETVDILERRGVRFSFAVDHRDITEEDMRNNPHRLPRWDCNVFEYGHASKGISHPWHDKERNR